MRMTYPVTLSKTASGTVIADFRDVPQALTEAPTEGEALMWAQDALVVALSGYLDHGMTIPAPSAPRKSQRMIALPPLVAAKIAIHNTMLDQGISRVELAKRLDWDEKQVRRVLDLDHQSKFDQIEDAMRVLGKTFVIEVRDLVAI